MASNAEQHATIVDADCTSAIAVALETKVIKKGSETVYFQFERGNQLIFRLMLIRCSSCLQNASCSVSLTRVQAFAKAVLPTSMVMLWAACKLCTG